MVSITRFSDIDAVIEALEAGEVIIYPTETVYGIGCLIAHTEAIERIAAIKESPDDASYLLLIPSRESISQYCSSVPDFAEGLMNRFWPGPLTLILPAKISLPSRLIGPGGGVGLRQSPDVWVDAILDRTGSALISTSANRSGHPAAGDYREIDPSILHYVDLGIDAGKLPGSVSTVIDCCGDKAIILRDGVITRSELSGVVDL